MGEVGGGGCVIRKDCGVAYSNTLFSGLTFVFGVILQAIIRTIGVGRYTITRLS